MMIQNTKQKGVSPVIGVILMVAITVIIAAVVANFVLDLGGTLSQDADATVTFDESVEEFGDPAGTYELAVTVTSMDNADYVYLQSPDVTFDDTNSEASNDDLAGNVPTDAEETGFIAGGDRVVLTDLAGDETIQVMGGLDGEENQIQSYDLSDAQGWT